MKGYLILIVLLIPSFISAYRTEVFHNKKLCFYVTCDEVCDLLASVTVVGGNNLKISASVYNDVGIPLWEFSDQSSMECLLSAKPPGEYKMCFFNRDKDTKTINFDFSSTADSTIDMPDQASLNNIEKGVADLYRRIDELERFMASSHKKEEMFIGASNRLSSIISNTSSICYWLFMILSAFQFLVIYQLLSRKSKNFV